jgi:hypothetical protein
MTIRTWKRAAVLAVLVLAVACASTGQKPETVVLHQGTNVLIAATQFQKGVTQATDAHSLTVAQGQTLTGYSELVYKGSQKLEAAVQRYRAATTLDLKALAAADVSAAVAEINSAVGKVLGAKLSDTTAGELIKLAGNIMAAVGAVQAEVAQGLK